MRGANEADIGIGETAPNGLAGAACVSEPSVETQTKLLAKMPRPRVFVVLFFFVAMIVAYGAYEHWLTEDRATTTQRATIDFEPNVSTVSAVAGNQSLKLTLPGQTEAFFTSTIFPRVTGYVAERRVDIGSHVKKGDLLIRIAAPDLDGSLVQAQGQLEQTKAALRESQAVLARSQSNLALATITSKRYATLTAQGYQTVQNNDNETTAVLAQQADVDNAKASIEVSEANIKAQQGTVDRLTALVTYERVLAPYEGIVVTRGVEVGDLVSADSKSGVPLFTVADERVLRVTVHVPQANAFAIQDGLPGTASLPQAPGKTFSGRVSRSSIALVDSSRVLNTQVDIENPTGELKPGAYVNVTFQVPQQYRKVTVLVEALIFNQAGLQVAIVDAGVVHLQTVSVYRDLGQTAELSDGLSGGERIIINPPVNLTDNMKVRAEQQER